MENSKLAQNVDRGQGVLHFDFRSRPTDSHYVAQTTFGMFRSIRGAPQLRSILTSWNLHYLTNEITSKQDVCCMQGHQGQILG